MRNGAFFPVREMGECCVRFCLPIVYDRYRVVKTDDGRNDERPRKSTRVIDMTAYLSFVSRARRVTAVSVKIATCSHLAISQHAAPTYHDQTTHLLRHDASGPSHARFKEASARRV